MRSRIVAPGQFTQTSFRRFVDKRLALENERFRERVVSRAEITVAEEIIKATTPKRAASVGPQRRDVFTEEEREVLAAIHDSATAELAKAKDHLKRKTWSINTRIGFSKATWQQTAVTLFDRPATPLLAQPEKKKTSSGAYASKTPITKAGSGDPICRKANLPPERQAECRAPRQAGMSDGIGGPSRTAPSTQTAASTGAKKADLGTGATIGAGCGEFLDRSVRPAAGQAGPGNQGQGPVRDSGAANQPATDPKPHQNVRTAFDETSKEERLRAALAAEFKQILAETSEAMRKTLDTQGKSGREVKAMVDAFWEQNAGTMDPKGFAWIQALFEKCPQGSAAAAGQGPTQKPSTAPKGEDEKVSNAPSKSDPGVPDFSEGGTRQAANTGFHSTDQDERFVLPQAESQQQQADALAREQPFAAKEAEPLYADTNADIFGPEAVRSTPARDSSPIVGIFAGMDIEAPDNTQEAEACAGAKAAAPKEQSPWRNSRADAARHAANDLFVVRVDEQPSQSERRQSPHRSVRDVNADDRASSSSRDAPVPNAPACSDAFGQLEFTVLEDGDLVGTVHAEQPRDEGAPLIESQSQQIFRNGSGRDLTDVLGPSFFQPEKPAELEAVSTEAIDPPQTFSSPPFAEDEADLGKEGEDNGLPQQRKRLRRRAILTQRVRRGSGSER